MVAAPQSRTPKGKGRASVRVFVSEFICGGAWNGSLPEPSLIREGAAMLASVVGDFARAPGVRVCATWDGTRGVSPFGSDVEVLEVFSADEEAERFRQLVRECDATLLIAPEFEGILAKRTAAVEAAGGHLLGSSSAAVAHCADKLRVAETLQAAGIPTIPAESSSFENESQAGFSFPWVIKPRDGAGSQSTFRVNDAAHWQQLLPDLLTAPLLRQAIRQPFVSGRPLSVGLILNDEGEICDYLPPCDQLLSDDGRFRYLGGRVPAAGVPTERIHEVAAAACRLIPGLRGYIGIDLVLPEGADTPVIVEINPRLTTSWLGYSVLCQDNLAQRVLSPGRSRRPLRWRSATIDYVPQGPTLSPREGVSAR